MSAKSAIAALFAGALALFAVAPASVAQGVAKDASKDATTAKPGAKIGSKFGAWEIRCDRPTGAPREQCALMQSLAAADRPNLTLVVMLLKPADGKPPILRMIAPLGVWIGNGIALSIDADTLGRAPFVRCLSSGCIADVLLDDKLIGKLEAGKTATFVLYDTPEAGVGLPLALANLKDGLDTLK
ncbi:MAG: invasion associated locus B family protein [Hyphomicrobiales bacterium]|nr:invasion associated locus B family protein [Hyphomicrobiales bacterium]MDE2016391.1 invasion associated locus B family protein [Hyphomicrobiales bacterium]